MHNRADITQQDELSKVSNSPSSHSYDVIVNTLGCALAANERVALVVDPSLEGVLSATGVSYFAHAASSHLRFISRKSCQGELGEVLIEGPSLEHDDVIVLARRVFDGFERAISRGCPKQTGKRCSAACTGGCMRKLIYACASDEPEMPNTVFSYLRLGFDVGPELRFMLAHPTVAKTLAYARFVSNECEHTRQFVRFSHMADGSFFARFKPKANTIPLTASYFAARLGSERFCIADPLHGIAAFHEAKRKPYIMRLDAKLMDELVSRKDFARDEPRVRALWQSFYEHVSLLGRGKSERGYDLRASWMPKRFWEGLTELGA